MGTPSRREDLEAICTFYEVYGQRNFRIEVTPLARPADLAGWITSRDLACEPAGTFKMWRRAERPVRHRHRPLHLRVGRRAQRGSWNPDKTTTSRRVRPGRRVFGGLKAMR